MDFLISQVIDLATGPAIITIDKSHLQQTTLQCRRVLMDQPQHRMPIKEFVQQYSQYYMKQCNLDEFRKNLTNVVRVCINLMREIIICIAVKIPQSIETGWLNILKNLEYFWYLWHLKNFPVYSIKWRTVHRTDIIASVRMRALSRNDELWWYIKLVTVWNVIPECHRHIL